jgi:hypothetical protein
MLMEAPAEVILPPFGDGNSGGAMTGSQVI